MPTLCTGLLSPVSLPAPAVHEPIVPPTETDVHRAAPHPQQNASHRKFHPTLTLCGHVAGIGSGFALAARLTPPRLLAGLPLVLGIQSACILPVVALARHLVAKPSQATDAAVELPPARGFWAKTGHLLHKASGPVLYGVQLFLGLGPAIAALAPPFAACAWVAGTAFVTMWAISWCLPKTSKLASSVDRTPLYEHGLQALRAEIELSRAGRDAAGLGNERPQGDSRTPSAWRALAEAEMQHYSHAIDTLTLGRSWPRMLALGAVLGSAGGGLYLMGIMSTQGAWAAAPAIYLPLCLGSRAIQELSRPTNSDRHHAAQQVARSLATATLLAVVVGRLGA